MEKSELPKLDGFEEITLCICPRCLKKHKTKLHWIGNGIPRIYCNRFNTQSKQIEEMGINCGNQTSNHRTTHDTQY